MIRCGVQTTPAMIHFPVHNKLPLLLHGDEYLKKLTKKENAALSVCTAALIPPEQAIALHVSSPRGSLSCTVRCCCRGTDSSRTCLGEDASLPTVTWDSCETKNDGNIRENEAASVG